MFTALGKIEKLIVFEYESVIDQQDEKKPLERFNRIRNKYAEFVKAFRKASEMEVFVFFTFMIPRKDDLEYVHDSTNRLWLIAVNVQANVSIPTRWVQDTMLKVSENTIQMPADKALSKGLCDLIRKYTGINYSFETFSGICDGGNIQVGKSKNTYLLAGPKQKYNIGSSKLKELFSLNRTDQVVELENNDQGPLNSFFYHLDLFVALAGTLNNGSELILLASPLLQETGYPAPSPIKEYPELTKRVLAQKLSGTTFRYEPVPYLIVNIADPFPFALSYTNCIVEQYKEHGNTVRQIYFPDYNITLQEWIAFLESNYPDSLYLEAHNNLLKAAEYYNITGFKTMTVPQLGYAVIKTIQDDLKDKFEAIEQTKTLFIPFRYEYVLGRQASLHCMTFAICRDNY